MVLSFQRCLSRGKIRILLQTCLDPPNACDLIPYDNRESLWTHNHFLCHLIHYLRLSHHLIVLNYVIGTFDKLKSVSSERISITDAVFDGVEVRVFEPPAKQDETLKRSVVYIHGGGWALASARTSLYNNLCRIMAESLNAVVVSVEYRLVPEVCFPEQFHDALRATRHFLHPDVLAEYSVDPSRVAISGDSAGGNLAAAVCQQVTGSVSHTLTAALAAQRLTGRLCCIITR
uniref:Neutral cholesterol ester hydrolase 1 n=1 Tax=Nothoprocta perdicaria TaxID=30464 RepID=A0A8C6YTR2_NOTPE